MRRYGLGALSPAAAGKLIQLSMKTVSAGSLVLVLASALLGAACGDAPPLSPSSVVSVRGTEWSLRAIDGTAIAADRPAPTLLLGDDSHANGFAGCNHFSAAYSITSESLRVSSIAMTRMFCAETMELEQQYVSVLQATRAYRLNGARLELRSDTGLVAVFEPR
jgi:heat shock protein HslJ